TLALARRYLSAKSAPVALGPRLPVSRKTGRHPIHHHADAGLMTLVNEVAQFVRSSTTARRCEIICDLIAPRTFERLFCDRQQLNVGVSHFEHVRQQRLG